MRTAPLFTEFEARGEATREAIRRVLDRWQAPSPYRSYAQYEWALAEAYQARVAFYRDLIEYVTAHGPSGVVFSTLLDAASGCDQIARDCAREARQSARREQERAFDSYADNIVAAIRTEHSTNVVAADRPVAA
jgi:hypothetical protein